MKRQKDAALRDDVLGGTLSAEQRHEKELGKYSLGRRAASNFHNFILEKKPELANEKATSGSFSRLARILDQAMRCSLKLYYHRYPLHGNVHRLVGGITCQHHLWCPCCAFRRSARLAKTYLPCFKALLQENPNLVPVLITWTVKHGPDLKERFEHIRRVQRTMLARRRDHLNHLGKYLHPSPLTHLHGGAGSYEFKRGRNSGEWNFHIHEVALIDRREFVFTEQLRPVRLKKGETEQQYKRVYVPQELEGLLCQELWKVSGDSYVVDVRGLYPREGYERLNGLPEADLSKPVYTPPSADEENPDTPDTLFSGLCEAFKYSVKPDELSHEDWFEAATYLQRRRLFYSYGILRNVEVPEDTSDDRDEDWMIDAPFEEKVYSYFFQHGQYELTQVNQQENAIFPAYQPASEKRKKKAKTVRLPNRFREEVKQFLRKFEEQSHDAAALCVDSSTHSEDAA